MRLSYINTIDKVVLEHICEVRFQEKFWLCLGQHPRQVIDKKGKWESGARGQEKNTALERQKLNSGVNRVK